MREGSRRKRVQFIPLTASEAPFPIPGTWIWVRVGQITRDRGQTVPTSDFTYIDVTSIDKDLGRLGHPAVLSATEAPSRARKIVSRGDVLYSCVRPYLLNIAIVEADLNPPPIASTAFAVLDGFGLVEPRFLWTVLRSPYFVECVEDKMRGQAYPAINDSDFSQLPVPLPPLAEQRRLVTKVDELMALCDELAAVHKERELHRDALRAVSLHRLATTADEGDTAKDVKFFLKRSERLITKPCHLSYLRQAILDLALHGRLVAQHNHDGTARDLVSALAAQRPQRLPVRGAVPPTAVEKPLDPPYDLPSNWAWVPLAAVADIVMGQSPPGSTYNKAGDGIPLINGPVEFSPGPFGTTKINQYTTAPTQVCKKGDFLLCVRGSTTGRTNVAGFDACLGRGVAAIRPLAGDAYIRLFLWRHRASIIAMGRGIAFPSVTRKQLASLFLPFPPLAEQTRLVARVHELLALCDGLEDALASAQDQRSQLLQELLRLVLTTGDLSTPGDKLALTQLSIDRRSASPR